MNGDGRHYLSHSCSTLPRANGKRSKSSSRGSKRSSLADSTVYTPLERIPSQANMWSTTVPQSLVNQTLGSRHAPTRNSLRHSRMLVLSRSFGGVVPRKYLPPVLEEHRLGTSLVALQFILGLILTGFACYALLWSPNLAAQDLPHYSGLSFLLSGWFGIMLMSCCRHYYPGTRQSGCVFPVRPLYIITNVIMSSISFLFGLFGSLAHTLHFAILLEDPICSEVFLNLSAPVWLYSLRDPHSSQPVSCRCESNSSLAFFQHRTREYPGLPCRNVHSVLISILGSSAILNLLGVISALWFIVLLVRSRGKPPGPRVQSGGNSSSLMDGRRRRKSIV